MKTHANHTCNDMHIALPNAIKSGNPWHDAQLEVPIKGREIIMVGDSGYRMLRQRFIVNGFYDAEWRARDPWRDCCGNALSDNGWKPLSWAYLEDLRIGR